MSDEEKLEEREIAVVCDAQLPFARFPKSVSTFEKKRRRKFYRRISGGLEIGQLGSFKVKTVSTIINMEKKSAHYEAPATRREHIVSQPRAPQGCKLAMKLTYHRLIAVKTRSRETIDGFSPTEEAPGSVRLDSQCRLSSLILNQHTVLYSICTTAVGPFGK